MSPSSSIFGQWCGIDQHIASAFKVLKCSKPKHKTRKWEKYTNRLYGTLSTNRFFGVKQHRESYKREGNNAEKMRREFRKLLLDKRKNAPKLINWEYESECLMNWKKNYGFNINLKLFSFCCSCCEKLYTPLANDILFMWGGKNAVNHSVSWRLELSSEPLDFFPSACWWSIKTEFLISGIFFAWIH